MDPVENQNNTNFNQGLSSTDESTPVGSENIALGRVFSLKQLNLSIPWGKMCAIIGPVGSGILQLIIFLACKIKIPKHSMQ